jgi:hypothetical protein
VLQGSARLERGQLHALSGGSARVRRIGTLSVADHRASVLPSALEGARRVFHENTFIGVRQWPREPSEVSI